MQFKLFLFFKQLIIIFFLFQYLFIFELIDFSIVKHLLTLIYNFAFFFSSLFILSIPQFKYLFTHSWSSFELNALKLIKGDLNQFFRINSFSLASFIKIFWFSHINWLRDPLHKFYMEEEFKKQTIIWSVDIDVNRLM